MLALRWLAALFMILAFIGFLDASYLTVMHYRVATLPCSLFGGGCDRVTASSYATVGNFPIALLGTIYYLLILILSFTFWLDNRKVGWFTLASHLTVIGFIATLWLFYLQAAVLKSFCTYCLLSALITAILFVAGFFVRSARHQAVASLVTNRA